MIVMTNRYDKIPDHKVIKSAMQQELTDKQIEYVRTEIEKAVLENKHKVYIGLDSFNPSQKKKLGQVLKSKGYKFVEELSRSFMVNL